MKSNKILITAIACAVFYFLIFFTTEMMRPIPFLSDYEKKQHEDYKILAVKLNSLGIMSVDINSFPSRTSFINKLITSKIFSAEQINILADLECQNTNLLYNDKVIFWKTRKNSVSYVDGSLRVRLVSISEFERKKKRTGKHKSDIPRQIEPHPHSQRD